VAYRAEEYVAAESLDVALRHYAPASMSQVLPFVAQLAGALDFARTAGVGHGALHPRDIFVTPDEARATGFGVVEALERVGLRAPVRRPYTAPERVDGREWGASADVFSLAAITYELITARRPSGTGGQIGSLDGSGVGRDGAGLVHAVLARAMDEDPRRRFASALEFASALDSASQGRAPQGPSLAVPAAAAAAAPALTLASDEDAENPQVMAEEDVDDIAGEQEEDEAHAVLIAESHDAEQADRTLFDDEHDEAIEDLALDPRHDVRETERFADEFSAAAAAEALTPHEEAPPARSAADEDVTDRYLGVASASRAVQHDIADEPAVAERYGARQEFVPPHRPGPSWIAAALLVGLALLVGFVAGQMIDPAGDPDATTTAQADPPPSAPAPADSTSPAAPAAADDRSGTPPVQAGASEGAAPVASPPAPEPRTTPPPEPPPSVPRTGTLRVRSTPAGASVTVDGKWRGRTPLTLEDVAFGRREVRVVQQGYAVATEGVTLSPDAPSRSLSVRLERTRAATPPAAPSRTQKPAPSRTQKPAAPARTTGYTGTIYVDSLPRGAEVFVNGRSVGTTPLLVPEVPVGSQIVRLQLEDHRTWSTSVRVVAGQQVKVSGSLERIR
jgi:hypothetical protein